MPDVQEKGQYTVNIKIKANEAEGIEAAAHSVNVVLGRNLKESSAAFGEGLVYEHFVRSAQSKVAGQMRTALSNGTSADALQSHFQTLDLTFGRRGRAKMTDEEKARRALDRLSTDQLEALIAERLAAIKAA